MILGRGQEGVVTRLDSQVCKRFHLGKPTDSQVHWLRTVLSGAMPYLPEAEWRKDGGSWCAHYPWFESAPADNLTLTELRDFFTFCLARNIVTPNIKHANFRRQAQGLTFIDIGGDVLPMNVDYFRDACARGFMLAVHGWTDDELARRSAELRNERMLSELPGFPEFYSSILELHAQQQWSSGRVDSWPPNREVESRVTLLIKACAMDAEFLTSQVNHIVGQLEHPRRFTERVLALDPFRGPFLRQHCPGDWSRLLAQAERLRAEGLIDRVLISPDEPEYAAILNQRWFNIACTQTHCIRGVPVVPQIWAFEQVRTRYVLQCDADMLIGRRDLGHDYLSEIVEAAAAPGVLGIAFNICHHEKSTITPYDAPPGEYMPEVTCGLIDLERTRACLPLPNSLTGGRLTLTWYRSLQQYQRTHGLRTLRGGDPRTFCVHPPNSWKTDVAALDRARNLVAQAALPAVQQESWALAGVPADWQYEQRHEPLVFLVRGRNTPTVKIERCLRSLSMQDDQAFGVVLIDDASDSGAPAAVNYIARLLIGRCTLVCRSQHQGYMPNLLLAARSIIANPETLIVILDLDDALLSASAVSRLKLAVRQGADVVLGAMFRPNKPTKLYHPSFVESRKSWGGEVWIHLRSFQKRLLDGLPEEDLRLDGDWIERCEDYATMIPLVEMANKPVYLPEYLYFHERSTPSSPELRSVKDEIIRRIINKPARQPLLPKT